MMSVHGAEALYAPMPFNSLSLRSYADLEGEEATLAYRRRLTEAQFRKLGELRRELDRRDRIDAAQPWMVGLE